MQAGGDPLDTGGREVLGDRRDDGGAAPGQAPPGEAQVPVVGGGAQQAPQHELVEDGAPAVLERLGLGHRAGEARREHEPAEAQAGRERLAGRAGVGDLRGREGLQRADGLAVEAELGVVVVLDDQAVALAGPGGQRGAPRRREDHARAGSGARA